MMRKPWNRINVNGSKTSIAFESPDVEAIYADPKGYLRSLGIEAELVAEHDAPIDTQVLAAA